MLLKEIVPDAVILEVGHIRKNCKEERNENVERVEIKCSNCDEVGHRVRDCKVKRKYKRGCRNCG